jgi:hypothetical protein
VIHQCADDPAGGDDARALLDDLFGGDHVMRLGGRYALKLSRLPQPTAALLNCMALALNLQSSP